MNLRSLALYIALAVALALARAQSTVLEGGEPPAQLV